MLTSGHYSSGGDRVNIPRSVDFLSDSNETFISNLYNRRKGVEVTHLMVIIPAVRVIINQLATVR